MEDDDCLDLALSLNHWATDEELLSYEVADKKNTLMNSLNKVLNAEVHSFIDLSLRDVAGDKGSLCGLAALYQALVNTILSKSQLKGYSFDDMKAAMATEMENDPKGVKKIKDTELLKDFFQCKIICLVIYWIYFHVVRGLHGIIHYKEKKKRFKIC